MEAGARQNNCEKYVVGPIGIDAMEINHSGKRDEKYGAEREGGVQF